MELQQASQEKHTIQAYTDSSVTIQGNSYHNSIILTRDEIISPWHIDPNVFLTPSDIAQFKALKPEIVLIGSRTPEAYIQSDANMQLLQSNIGVECLSIDAACRTFNILLSEYRQVVLGLIIPQIAS